MMPQGQQVVQSENFISQDEDVKVDDGMDQLFDGMALNYDQLKEELSKISKLRRAFETTDLDDLEKDKKTAAELSKDEKQFIIEDLKDGFIEEFEALARKHPEIALELIKLDLPNNLSRKSKLYPLS